MGESYLEQKSLSSDFIGPRTVDIWLPPGYADEVDRRYPVIYMHDGQALFQPASSLTGWDLQRTLRRLVRENGLPKPIVVGIWRSERRFREYSPQKAFERYLSPPVLQAVRRTDFYPISDAYLAFLVKELKPLIDSGYRSLPDAASTFLIGSSLGGIVSVYAVCEHPGLFGGAGCLSTHWPVGAGVMLPYLKDVLPRAGRHRFYFDHGSGNMEAQYQDFQKQVDALMLERGYTPGRDWTTRVFPGHDHSERVWRRRVENPMEFLLRGR